MTEEEARELSRPYTAQTRIGGYALSPADPSKCCAEVSKAGHNAFNRKYYQCDKKPKVFYGSLGFCGIHDPKRELEKRARWKRESEAANAKFNYDKAMREYTAACVELVERLAEGDCEEMTATIVAEAMQLVSRKPTNPSNTDSIGGK